MDPDVSTVEKGRYLDPDKRYLVQKQKDVEKQNSVFLAVSRVEGYIQTSNTSSKLCFKETDLGVRKKKDHTGKKVVLQKQESCDCRPRHM